MKRGAVSSSVLRLILLAATFGALAIGCASDPENTSSRPWNSPGNYSGSTMPFGSH